MVIHKLPMGDKFIVQHDASSRYKRWRGLIQKKNGDTRISCNATQFKRQVEEYFKTTCMVQDDCLEGLNPYVTKEYACNYKAQL